MDAVGANISIVMILITCFFLFAFLAGGILLVVFIINAVSKPQKPQDRPNMAPEPIPVTAAEEAPAEQTTLGETIKIYREKRKMTQEFVAESLGVSRQAVSKWENGTSEPSTGNLLALAKLFGVSAAELLEGVE